MMKNELYEKMTRLQWLLHKEQLRAWAQSGPLADPTRGQGRIIAILKLRDGISTKDLSFLLGVRVSSLNELLAKLEKAGYVTRAQSEEDKRVMLVQLTEKGRNEQPAPPLDTDDVFACLTDEEQNSLGEYLDRIIDALRAKGGDEEEDEALSSKMEALRARFGATFEKHWSKHFGRHGFPHGHRNGPGLHSRDPRNGFGPDRNDPRTDSRPDRRTPGDDSEPDRQEPKEGFGADR